jgi:hypothetical protein
MWCFRFRACLTEPLAFRLDLQPHTQEVEPLGGARVAVACDHLPETHLCTHIYEYKLTHKHTHTHTYTHTHATNLLAIAVHGFLVVRAR